ncbi:MAG: sulfur carrier protein ThiS [Anaerovoracaceae bacterium]|jgi:sulfur carrier protein ThiS
MKIMFNDRECEVESGMKVYDLTRGHLGRLKIWLNDRQLRQSEAKNTGLSDGDQVIIRRASGGGCC